MIALDVRRVVLLLSERRLPSGVSVEAETWDDGGDFHLVFTDASRGYERGSMRMCREHVRADAMMRLENDRAAMASMVEDAITRGLRRLSLSCLEHEDCRNCAELGDACAAAARRANASMRCAD